MEMFWELNGDDLIHFIMAHQDAENPQYKVESRIPMKGSVKEVKDGAANRIKIAYECRATPNCVEGKLPFDLSIFKEEEQAEKQESLHILSLTLGEDDSILPSNLLGTFESLDILSLTLGKENFILPFDLLGSKQWVEQVIDLFDLEKLDVSMEVTQYKKDNTNLFAKIL